MKVAIPTNDRETIAVHTGRCNEFAIFELRNGQIQEKTYTENKHAHQHEEGNCSHCGQGHSHQEILNALNGVDLLLYYAMGKHLREELTNIHIAWQKATSIRIDDLLNEQLEAQKTTNRKTL